MQSSVPSQDVRRYDWDTPVSSPNGNRERRDEILEISSVSLSFGGLRAVQDCSFSVQRGTITGLIGPNGAGKTTMFNIISGFLNPDRGTISLDGQRIDRDRPHEIVDLGLVRTFQIPKPIASMTVLENLVLAAKGQAGEHLWKTWLFPARVEVQENEIIDKALWVLEYVNLIELRDEYGEKLSGGQKKLLEFARTLMVDPKVVLLDEPAAGVNRTLMRELVRYIQEQCEQRGVTYLIIEHDMDLVARLCNPIVVMSQGSVLFEGSPEEVQQNEEVLEAYLGSQFR